MSTFNQIVKGPTKKLDNDLVGASETVDFSDIENVSGGDTVNYFTVPAGAATDRFIVNVITAESGISGTLNDGSSLGSLVNLGITGATYVSSQKVYTADATLSLVTSGTGAIGSLKVAIQGVYSIIDVV